MTDYSPDNSELNGQLTRIHNALEQLETRPDVSKLTSDAILENQRLSDENTILQEKVTKLSNELQQLQQEYVDLQSAANQVAKKLDGSIEQLDMLAEASA